jgi:DNA-binding SARP family transcriptional activator
MELRVLGPLGVYQAGAAISLGPRKQQVVLALLALNAGRVVGLDVLIDELWPESPPSSAVPNVRGYAGNLRRSLTAVGFSPPLVRRERNGYLLDPTDVTLDAAVFRRECSAGETALRAGDPDSAVARYTEALDLWRGPALAGLPRGPQLAARCAALDEERAVAVESLAESLLSAGEVARAVPLLREHVGAAPLRERGYELLVRALDLCGDVAGGLAAYAEVRSILADRLGVEPGPRLRQLQMRLLRRDGSEESPPMADGRWNPVSVSRPHELPPDVGHFVGRAEETRRIARALGSPVDSTRHRPMVVVLHGPGGAGKSALAAHVAHQVSYRFPDGQLYVDLFGSTPGLRALSAREVVVRCLSGLGVPQREQPAGEAEALALFRTLTLGRRLLVILDNADDAATVAPAFPAAAGSAVIVTARRPLGAVDADVRIRIGGLPEEDGAALLTRLAGQRSLHPADVHEIVSLCGHLPLAVRIAAGRLASRPDLSSTEFVDRLANSDRRLDELELDGLAVRACIRAGYEALASSPVAADGLAARAFRALGLLNAPDVSPGVVAAMLDLTDVETARSALDRLVYVELLEPMPGGRYRPHDLVRLVAAGQAAIENDEGERTRWVLRAISYLATCMGRAREALTPGRALAIASLETNVQPPDFRDPVDADRWVKAEKMAMVGVIEQAAGYGSATAHAVLCCVEAMWLHCYMRRDWLTIDRVTSAARSAGSHAQDRRLVAWASLMTGRRAAEAGVMDEAVQDFERAVGLFSEIEDWVGVCKARVGLGITHLLGGDPVAGHGQFLECLTTSRRYNLAYCETLALLNSSITYSLLGRLDDALEAATEALAQWRVARDPRGVASALYAVAVIRIARGDLTGASAYVDEALEKVREVGYQIREGEALVARSEIHFRAARFAEAARDAAEAQDTAHARGFRYTETVSEVQAARIRLKRTGREPSEPLLAQWRLTVASAGHPRDVMLEWLLFGNGAPTTPGRPQSTRAAGYSFGCA